MAWHDHFVTAFKDFRFSSNRMRHSIKTAIASLIGYGFYLFTPLPKGQWIIISILVVMIAQPTVGSILQKSYLRIAGTMLGAIFASLTIYFTGGSAIGVAIALAISGTFFAYAATSSLGIGAAATLGASTVVIILLGQNPTYTLAALRFVEISLGIIIALLVSRYIFPILARDGLRFSMADTLMRLSRHYRLTIIRGMRVSGTKKATLSLLEKTIISAFAKQRNLLEEVKLESKRHRKLLPQYRTIIDCEVRIFRSINFMQYSALSSTYSTQLINELHDLELFHKQVTTLLPHLSRIIRTGDMTEYEYSLPELVESLKSHFKSIANTIEYEHIASINAYLFAANYMIDAITQLTNTLKELHEQTITFKLKRIPSNEFI